MSLSVDSPARVHGVVDAWLAEAAAQIRSRGAAYQRVLADDPIETCCSTSRRGLVRWAPWRLLGTDRATCTIRTQNGLGGGAVRRAIWAPIVPWRLRAPTCRSANPYPDRVVAQWCQIGAGTGSGDQAFREVRQPGRAGAAGAGHPGAAGSRAAAAADAGHGLVGPAVAAARAAGQRGPAVAAAALEPAPARPAARRRAPGARGGPDRNGSRPRRSPSTPCSSSTPRARWPRPTATRTASPTPATASAISRDELPPGGVASFVVAGDTPRVLLTASADGPSSNARCARSTSRRAVPTSPTPSPSPRAWTTGPRRSASCSLSDGGLTADEVAPAAAGRPGRARRHRTPTNRGIARLTVEPRGAGLHARVSVRNHGRRDVTQTLRIDVDGVTAGCPARSPSAPASSVDVELDVPTGDRVEAFLEGDDLLAADDHAVAVVTAGGPTLRRAGRRRPAVLGRAADVDARRHRRRRRRADPPPPTATTSPSTTASTSRPTPAPRSSPSLRPPVPAAAADPARCRRRRERYRRTPGRHARAHRRRAARRARPQPTSPSPPPSASNPAAPRCSSPARTPRCSCAARTPASASPTSRSACATPTCRCSSRSRCSATASSPSSPEPARYVDAIEVGDRLPVPAGGATRHRTRRRGAHVDAGEPAPVATRPGFWTITAAGRRPDVLVAVNPPAGESAIAPADGSTSAAGAERRVPLVERARPTSLLHLVPRGRCSRSSPSRRSSPGGGVGRQPPPVAARRRRACRRGRADRRSPCSTRCCAARADRVATVFVVDVSASVGPHRRRDAARQFVDDALAARAESARAGVVVFGGDAQRRPDRGRRRRRSAAHDRGRRRRRPPTSPPACASAPPSCPTDARRRSCSSATAGRRPATPTPRSRRLRTAGIPVDVVTSWAPAPSPTPPSPRSTCPGWPASRRGGRRSPSRSSPPPPATADVMLRRDGVEVGRQTVAARRRATTRCAFSRRGRRRRRRRAALPVLVDRLAGDTPRRERRRLRRRAGRRPGPRARRRGRRGRGDHARRARSSAGGVGTRGRRRRRHPRPCRS